MGPPANNLLKLNCDAAVSDHGAKAAAGGVFRNSVGIFIIGFASALKPCSILEAELLAIQAGIIMARKHGVERLLIHSDSLLAVRLITLGCPNVHPRGRLVRDIQRLMGHGDHYLLEHTFCEANQVADGLAKFGMTLDNSSRIFPSVPLFLSAAVRADSAGTCFPRGF